MRAYDPMSPAFRVFWLGVAVILCVGTGLLVAPGEVAPRWLWELPPFNARFLGAIYATELAIAVLMVLSNGWSPGRLVFPSATVFLVTVTVITFVEWDAFDPDRRATWGWLVVYILPALLIAAVALLRRSEPAPPAARPLGARRRAVLLASSWAIVAFGAALLVAPEGSTGYWPWEVDALHGRMYAGVFLAIGLYGLLLRDGGTALELLIGGVARAALGLLAIAGLLLADADLQRVSWDAGTWLWMGLFAALAADGCWLVRLAFARRATE